jgi:hypothetical protein
MGAMSKRMAASPTPAAGAGSASDLLSMLTPMLDARNDGSIVDDVIGLLGRFGGR